MRHLELLGSTIAPVALSLNMLKFIHIAASGGEGIFWLIVMGIWIFTQIKKATKNTSNPPASNVTNSAKDPYVAPQEEIADFLASLAGVPKTPKPTSVAPTPTHSTVTPSRARQQIPQAKTKTHKRKYQPQPEPIPAYTPPPPPPPPRKKVIIQDVHDSAYSERKARQSSIPDLTKDLGNKKALKKAIVLQEVLGPPIALR